MIETVREEEEGKLAKMKEDFESQTVETRNTNVEIMDTMRNALTRNIDDLDTKFDQQFQNYVNDTQAEAELYKLTLTKNKENQKNITKIQRDITKFSDQTRLYTMKMQ